MSERDHHPQAPRDYDEPSPAAAGGLPLPVLLNRAAVAVLAIGLLASVAIFMTAGPDQAGLLDDDAARRQYEFELEKIGGKAAVLAADFANWFGSLWHGRTLAFTVAILSVLIAGACAWVAREIALHASHEAAHGEDSRPQQPPRRDG
ncbi:MULTISPECIES: hypothetical protein [Cupriavidus]|uniref:hypothetical protein n=1 Tax=Cupriavidus TaxID=106589 RepID=UPI001E57392F|nr:MULTISPECIES: hypothetical protein [Cupriavidus]